MGRGLGCTWDLGVQLSEGSELMKKRGNDGAAPSTLRWGGGGGDGVMYSANCQLLMTTCGSFSHIKKCAHLAYDLWDVLVTVCVVLEGTMLMYHSPYRSTE